jgi:hypothetical protein
VTFTYADIRGMSKLFRLLFSLFMKGVKPEELIPDRFPGKQPPTATPKIPGASKPQTVQPEAKHIAEAYKSFRRKYPNGFDRRKRNSGFTFTELHNEDGDQD